MGKPLFIKKKDYFFLSWFGSFKMAKSKIKSTNPKMIFSSMLSPVLVYA